MQTRQALEQLLDAAALKSGALVVVGCYNPFKDWTIPDGSMIYAGQLIVSEGEIVTSDICQILDSYKAEYKMSYGYSGSPNALVASHMLIIVTLLALFFFMLF